MNLVLSGDIRRIDDYAEGVLGISKTELMARSGVAVAQVVRERIEKGEKIVFLAGKGNNGGDGYAAASLLCDDYEVIILDVFGEGQTTPEGKYHRARAIERGVSVMPYDESEECIAILHGADCIIDAIFGTGFHGELPERVKRLSLILQHIVSSEKIAIDIPLGVDADNGSVLDECINVSATVALSYFKAGTMSYPARAFVGEVVLAPLMLPPEVEEVLEKKYFLIDGELAREYLPVRPENSNKGTFGKLRIIAGSERYRGAPALALGAAVRCGVGLCEYVGPKSIVDALYPILPEAIYRPYDAADTPDALLRDDSRYGATLIGCGSDQTEQTLELVKALLSTEGSPLILDADAINALSSIGEEGLALLDRARRPVIITPHPLEFSRLVGREVSYVQLHRMELASAFAREHRLIVVLKGAGTLVCDGERVYINHTGSSALAKAGSGDVLAGALSSLVAMGAEPVVAAALAVYIHGLAADRLARVYSSYGVTPSDLPMEMAKVICEIQKEQKEK